MGVIRTCLSLLIANSVLITLSWSDQECSSYAAAPELAALAAESPPLSYGSKVPLPITSPGFATPTSTLMDQPGLRKTASAAAPAVVPFYHEEAHLRLVAAPVLLGAVLSPNAPPTTAPCQSGQQPSPLARPAASIQMPTSAVGFSTRASPPYAGVSQPQSAQYVSGMTMPLQRKSCVTNGVKAAPTGRAFTRGRKMKSVPVNVALYVKVPQNSPLKELPSANYGGAYEKVAPAISSGDCKIYASKPNSNRPMHTESNQQQLTGVINPKSNEVISNTNSYFSGNSANDAPTNGLIGNNVIRKNNADSIVRNNNANVNVNNVNNNLKKNVVNNVNNNNLVSNRQTSSNVNNAASTNAQVTNNNVNNTQVDKSVSEIKKENNNVNTNNETNVMVSNKVSKNDVNSKIQDIRNENNVNVVNEDITKSADVNAKSEDVKKENNVNIINLSNNVSNVNNQVQKQDNNVNINSVHSNVNIENDRQNADTIIVGTPPDASANNGVDNPVNTNDGLLTTDTQKSNSVLHHFQSTNTKIGNADPSSADNPLRSDIGLSNNMVNGNADTKPQVITDRNLGDKRLQPNNMIHATAREIIGLKDQKTSMAADMPRGSVMQDRSTASVQNSQQFAEPQMRSQGQMVVMKSDTSLS